MKYYNKKIIYYRYLIWRRHLDVEEIDVYETPKCYIGENCRISKADDDVAQLKNRTSYTYVDFYSTKDTSKEYAVEKILEVFREDMMRWKLTKKH